MKKLLSFILVLVGVVSYIQAEDSVYVPVISGDITTVFKIQDSYISPFDNPEWDADQRAGASNRDSQFIRVAGNLNVSSGNPGVTEWFGVLSLSVDANAPDNADNDIYDDVKILDDNINYEDIEVNLTNAFVMWRPLEISGGRPLGISVGNQTIKATANTAYSHLWGGDLDGDFVLHSMSALINKPMINVDFHVNDSTGIGYAFAKGASDFIQNSAVFNNDYALTNVVYAEAGLAGFQLNAAFQYAVGNRDLKNLTTTDAGNTYYTADYAYESSTINAQLSYNINIMSLNIMPYVGYQLLWGDEASIGEYQDNEAFTTKGADLNILTAGGVISSNVLGKKVTLAGGYNLVNTEDFNGLDGIEDGHLDAAIEEQFTSAIYDADTASFSGICGGGSSTYSVVGLDAMYNLEASVELSERASVSLFLNGQIAKTPENYKVTETQLSEIYEVIDNDAMIQYGLSLGADGTGTTPMTTQDAVDLIEQSYNSQILSGTEWTDSMSFGIQVNYKF